MSLFVARGTRRVSARVERTERSLSEAVMVANGLSGRTRGLLGRPRAAAEAGLLLIPCNGVHTCGMQYAIDVVFLGRDDRVIRIDRALAPWRMVPWVRGAHATLELAADNEAVKDLRVGDRLCFELVE